MTGQPAFSFALPPLGRVSRAKTLHASLPFAPRVSHAAVRVPDPRHLPPELQFPAGQPQIFVHEGARQALERRLSQAYHRLVLLSVTDNTRHMISRTQRDGVLQVRLHHMFLDAPAVVQEALVRYVVEGERTSSAVVSKYIEDHGYRIRATRPVSTPLVTAGETHDLFAIYRTVNEKYFAGAVDALITWGRRTPKPKESRRSIKLGSYSAVERLIRVHPVLDRPWVPRYFVSYIVYHEMLHHVIPQSQGSGRRMLHPPLFKARERLFRDFDRSLTWERTHIGRLLRS
ncbi:hypothetical protein A7982_12603 [Minicystis rosea]|nr:hypothetical protein A7982_12603 [Minicystis rosea]